MNMRKIVLSVMAVLILTGMAFSQDAMQVIPKSELIDQGPVKEDAKFPSMKSDSKKSLPAYLAPPSARGVYTGITGYWDFQTNGGPLDYLEVNPVNINKIHAIMMVGTDTGATSTISSSRRTAYSFSSDGGETWKNPNILNKGPIARSGYPAMTIENLGGGVYAADIVNHAVHPGDPEGGLSTALSLQQTEGSDFGDAIYPEMQWESDRPIWPCIKIAANGNMVIVAGRPSPGGTYAMTYNILGGFTSWTPLDTLEGGARTGLAVGADGRIAAGWFYSPGGIETYTIAFKESFDNGVTWGPLDSIRTKAVDDYIYFGGFDIMYIGNTLYIATCGGKIIDGSVPYRTSKVMLYDQGTNVNRTVMDSLGFPFLKRTTKTSQSNHGFSFHQPTMGYTVKGGVTSIFVAASAHIEDMIDSKNFHYSDIVFAKTTDNGTTWTDAKNITRTSELDERYPSVSSFNPVLNDSSWMYLAFQEDRVPGRNNVIPDGDSRPVSRASLKFMRVNVDYQPMKDIAVVQVKLSNYSGIRAVGVVETVKVIIKNDGREANPTTLTVNYKAGSLPANSSDGVNQVFTPTWTGKDNKYAYLTFTQTYNPLTPGLLTIFVRNFYTGDEDPGTNDGKTSIIIVPPKDLAVNSVTRITPEIYPKTSVTPYLPSLKLKTEVLNLGGIASGAYELRWFVNNVAQTLLGRPSIPYAGKDNVELTYNPPAIGTYDIRTRAVASGDTTLENDTLAIKVRAYSSNSFSIAYDDSNDVQDSNWGTDSLRRTLTSGVRFTPTQRTKLQSADVCYSVTYQNVVVVDSVLLSIRQGLNDSTPGAVLWQKWFKNEYIVRTNGSQWVSFPIDQELWFNAGEEFWIQIFFPALHGFIAIDPVTGTKSTMLVLPYPQAVDYYPEEKQTIWNEGNRSFFSEDTGKTYFPLRENYRWVPAGPNNKIAMRNLVRAICLDTTLTDQISVRSGWNMVSIPVRREELKTTLFPTAQSNAFTYRNGAYAIDTILKLGPAYWMKFASAQTFSMLGGFVYEHEYPVTTGWNMIGSIIKPTNVSAIIPEPAGIITSPYYEFGAAGYAKATQIRPGFGYWIKVNAPGKLKISATTVAKEETELAELSKFNSITITDKFNSSQTLYFGENTDGNFPVAYYTLPPSPPAGVLDVRFASQRLVEAYPAQFDGTLQYPISVNADAYPLTVSWNLANRTRSFFVENSFDGKKQSTISLNGDNGSTQILRASSIILTIDSKGLPTEFMLGQNYPNPFNPSTKFEFAMPKNARVDVIVYDILGSKVATLFDGIKDAGYHSVEWNGQNSQGHVAPSGVYFIKMTSDGFSAVRKALMLK